MTATFQRIRVHVVRVGPCTALVSVPSFAGGKILVPARTLDIMLATGMTRAQLTGADLMAVVNTSATTEDDVRLHGWRGLGGDGQFAGFRPAASPGLAVPHHGHTWR